MGLVEKKGGEGTVATFYPQHPSLLMHTLEGKEKELALAKEMLTYSLGSLSSKYNLITGKPSVQFFEGTEAVRKITGDYPTTDKEIRQIIDISEFIKAIPSETEGYRNERIKKGDQKRMLLPATQSNTDYADKSTEMTEFGFLKNISEIEAAIQIYDERVTMLKVNSDTKIGVLIEDKDIANTMKKVFDALWEKSK
jgi:hypothetical protein